jgi:hypothetical protein
MESAWLGKMTLRLKFRSGCHQMSSRAEITGRKQETGSTGRTQNLNLSSLCAQETPGAQGFCFCQGEGREFESRHPLQFDSYTFVPLF